MAQADPTASRKFYGRKQGHKLNAYQERLMETLLPRVTLGDPNTPDTSTSPLPSPSAPRTAEPAPIDLAAAFASSPFSDPPAPLTSYALEIGFGGGEHLLARAQAQPQCGFIGCEVFRNGIAKLIRGIDDARLSNIRIYPDDVRDILDDFPDQCFDVIYLLYPDPWPKIRHHKRRFISQAHLDHICRLLTPQGSFFVASDIPDYVNWTLAHIRQHGGLEFTAEKADDWRQPFKDGPSTRYEKKALAAGRVPSYLHFHKI